MSLTNFVLNFVISISLLSTIGSVATAQIVEMPERYKEVLIESEQDLAAFKDPVLKKLAESRYREWVAASFERDEKGRSVETYHLNAEKALVITHTQFLDENTQQINAKKLYYKFKKLQLPSKVLVWDIWTYPLSFFEERFKNGNIVPFDMFGDMLVQGYAPKISVQGGNIFLAGGNFSACLCQTVISILSTAVDNKQSINLYFVRDAIYDGYDYFHTYMKTHRHLRLPKKFDSMMWTDFVFKSDKDFLDMIKIHWLRGRQNFPGDGLGGCVGIDGYGEQLTYEIYRDGRFLGKTGNGQIKAKLHFIQYKDVDRYLGIN